MSRRMPTALRWGGYVAIAVAFAIACAFLSNWQFTRNAERSAQLQLVEANYDAEPGTLETLVPRDDTLPEDSEWHPVLLRGSYLPEQTLLVRNRPHGGTSAFEVLVPFHTDDGRILLIDRGWIPPAENSDPSTIPVPPAGIVEVVARLRPSESLPRSGRVDAPAGQVPTISLPLIDQTLGEPAGFITGAYGIVVTEDPAATPMPQALDSPSDDPGPHLSYAIQWILFAIMGFAFIGYVIRTEGQVRREESTGQPRRARVRRRDVDADDEDALVDALPR